MRTFTLLLLSLTVATHAADTAYSALRVLAAQRGEDSLRRVMELRGNRGTWKILLADSRGRSGLREIQVRNGHVVSDTKSAKPHGITTPLNLGALNLDSDGALTTVNQNVPHAFTADRVDYTLTNSIAQNVPVWVLKLHEPRDAGVTYIQIAADTGEVIAQPASPDDAPYTLADNGIDASADFDQPIVENLRTGSSKKKRPSQTSPRRDVPEAVERAVDHVERGARRLKRFLPF